jgi:hypothetical protein
VFGSIWPIIYQVHGLITTKGHHIDASYKPHYISAYHRRLRSFPQVKGPSMTVVLDLCRKANVTDPRDKVYGILGLLPPNIAASISPDYELSYEQVFYQFARTMIKDEKGLEAILSWCSFKELSSLPSWIPDWTTYFSRNHIQWLRRRKAAGSAAAEWSISPDDPYTDKQYLTCKGFTFDSVNSVSASLSENLPYRSEARTIQQPLTSTPPNHYGDEKSLKAALWRTLRHDHPYLCETKKTCLEIRWIDWSALSRDADGLSPDFWKSMTTITQNVFWQTFESFRQTNANFSILGLKLRDMFPEMDPWSQWWVAENSEDSEHIELLNQMASDMHLVVLALTGRRLVTTSTGYLGLAPAELLEGDIIAVLYGCNFPVVLRPCEDKFYFIGECYVDGVMDGELMEAKERGQYQERDITLC